MANFIYLFVIPLLFSLATTALGQDSKLIEAAKKEGGKVVVYGSLESSTVEAVTKGFQKETGLEVNYWRASATKVMDRALTEYRAGKPLYDVLFVHGGLAEILGKEGITAKYQSPAARGFDKEVIDPNLGPSYRRVIIGVVYNKSGIKPEEYPKSLLDLVDPKYKGKLVMPDPTQHTTTTQWLASLYKIMGKEKSEKFIRDLAATKPILVESLLPSAERVSTGETPIAVTYVKYAYIFGQKGAPLDYVRGDKLLGDDHYLALASKAPHPNGGKAYIDYFLADESMKIIAKMGEFVNRKAVYPPLPDANKIQYVPMDDLDKKAYAEKKKEYQRIFLR